METKIELTLTQLKHLLNRQKELTIERLSQHTYIYNKESTESDYKTLPIDKEKFKEYGMSTDYPSDVYVLSRYIS